MPNPSDIHWATSLSERTRKPPALLPLQQLVCYTDHTGELSRQMGDSEEPGRTYPGVFAISQLGRGVSAGYSGAPDSSGRPDRVQRFYHRFSEESGLGLAFSPSHALGIEGASPALILGVFDRYWGNSDFPIELPTKSDLMEILGERGEKVESTSTLRSIIYFYMRLYSDLADDARRWLAGLIANAFGTYTGSTKCPRSLQSWMAASSLLFSGNPANSLAADYNLTANTSFALYATQINLPERSSLFASVRLSALCLKLEQFPQFPDESHKKILHHILRDKEERIDQNWTVAAKSLQILVNRSIAELDGMPSDPWCDIIVDLGCHPDPQLSGPLVHRYWHWADSKQRDAARMAYVRRDLEVVFDYLQQAANQGQIGGHMVAPRVDFYRKLLSNKLIRDTRLFLGTDVHWELRNRMRREQFWDLHEAGDPNLCILALMLADGVNLTTGTKSFPMRFYRFDSKEFQDIWQDFSPKRDYPIFRRQHFMHDRPTCIRKTHQGDWKSAVIDEILPHPSLGRIDWSHYDL